MNNNVNEKVGVAEKTRGWKRHGRLQTRTL